MPSVGQQFADWTDMSSPSGGGLMNLAGAYLADKAGLIDLKNPGQKKQFEQGGLRGMLTNKIANAVLPPVQQPPSLSSVSPDNIDIGGGYNMASAGAVPPPAMPNSDVVVGGANPQGQVEGAALPPAQKAAPEKMSSADDWQDIDSHLPQFLSLIGMA